MLELLREMSLMAHRFEDFIFNTKEKNDQDILKKKYVQLTAQMEKLGSQIYDENDDFYLDTIKKVKDTELLIKKVNENQLKMIIVVDHIFVINENVDKILQGWKTGNDN